MTARKIQCAPSSNGEFETRLESKQKRGGNCRKRAPAAAIRSFYFFKSSVNTERMRGDASDCKPTERCVLAEDIFGFCKDFCKSCLTTSVYSQSSSYREVWGGLPPLVSGIYGTAVAECIRAWDNFSNFDAASFAPFCRLDHLSFSRFVCTLSKTKRLSAYCKCRKIKKQPSRIQHLCGRLVCLSLCVSDNSNTAEPWIPFSHCALRQTLTSMQKELNSTSS